MDVSALDLLGTTEPTPVRQALQASPLTAILEAGQLRYIRWHGAEVLRGIAYLLRDSAWGTLPIELSDLQVEQDPGMFRVTYAGRVDARAGRLAYRARIEGTAQGSLTFEVTATAETDFRTNRTGFVVLHPDDVAGRLLRVGHSDGRVEATTFPERISPDQPAFDIISLEHEPAPGLGSRVEFAGAVWEMEDQRNWSDASFKTYVRPLAWPFPYDISAGTTDTQQVTLSLSGQSAAVARAGTAGRQGRRTIPPLYLRLADGLPIPDELPLPGLARGLILRVRAEVPDRGRLASAAALAARAGMSLAVEAIFPQKDPAVEASACLDAFGGLPVDTLLVAATRDARTRKSGTLPDGEAALDVTLGVLRQSFRGRIGTGTHAFFTEFNRNPPPAADFAFFGVNPIVHAADDVSVMETLRVLPTIMDSAAQLLPEVGLWPGPLVLPATLNPYGPAPVETDGTTRTCLAATDPRHGALFGAAHLLAAVAATLPWAEAIAPLYVNGPAGLVGPDGGSWPVAFVQAEVSQAEGATVDPTPVAPGTAALAWEQDGRRTMLVANITPDSIELDWPEAITTADRLRPGSRGWERFGMLDKPLELTPYAVLRLGAPTRTGP